MNRFAALAALSPSGWRARALHFLRVEAGVLAARYRIWRAVAHAPSSSYGRRAALRRGAFEVIAAMQRAAQFAGCERLFSLWRIVHVPFVVVMLVSAVVHVVAVHAY